MLFAWLTFCSNHGDGFGRTRYSAKSTSGTVLTTLFVALQYVATSVDFRKCLTHFRPLKSRFLSEEVFYSDPHSTQNSRNIEALHERHLFLHYYFRSIR